MDDDEAISACDRAGEAAAKGGSFEAVRWPDLALEAPNLVRLAVGVFAVRLDLAREAFGSDFDSAASAERLEEAWRTDALQARYAPEGIFVRAAFTVRVALAADPDEVDPTGEPAAVETLTLAAEFCVSFVEQRHTRPFVDFMGGEVRRGSDGASRTLDAFAFRVEPAQAVEWGLNGVEPPG
jgi:hypothetical protein